MTLNGFVKGIAVILAGAVIGFAIGLLAPRRDRQSQSGSVRCEVLDDGVRDGLS